MVPREWHKEAYDENGRLKEEASLPKVIIRVFGFKYMLLAIPAVLAVSTNSLIDKKIKRFSIGLTKMTDLLSH